LPSRLYLCFLCTGQGAVSESKRGGDRLWGLGNGSLFLMGYSRGPGPGEPQVWAVRLMAKAPPSNRGGCRWRGWNCPVPADYGRAGARQRRSGAVAERRRAAAREKVSGGGGRSTSGSRGKLLGGRRYLLGGGWESRTVLEVGCGGCAAPSRSRESSAARRWVGMRRRVGAGRRVLPGGVLWSAGLRWALGGYRGSQRGGTVSPQAQAAGKVRLAACWEL